MRNYITGFLVLLFLALQSHAQDSASYEKAVRGASKKSSYPLNSMANKLKDALEQDDDRAAAVQYEKLSEQFSQNGDLSKAESYLTKALSIYTQRKDNDGIARVSRSLAKLQEGQQKYAPAIFNYKNAAEISTDKSLERANTNDALRLQNAGKPTVQEAYAKDNIDLFKKRGDPAEVSDAYKQVAETQVKQKNVEEAAKSFNKAIEAAPEDAAAGNQQLARQLVSAYSAANRIDTAIVLTKALVSEAEKKHDAAAEADHMITLSELYGKNKQDTEALSTLQKAYELAVANGLTLKAKNITELLARHYRSQGNTAAGIAAYQTFLQQLDTLIRKDSSLVDSRLFELTEGRIRELEQEKVLQAALLKKTTSFNYFLIGSVIVMLLLLLFIYRSFMAIKKRNKQIALQSLRREMNPHFIFNSLNSVNQYIAENNELEANRYLSSYSGLMRNVMEHSNKDFISISTELEQLEQYLELEYQRFRDKFGYRIKVDETLDTDLLLIPNMLLQPHLENAVWHGLRYKEQKGMLELELNRKGGLIEIVIRDNGIGLSRSQALKTVHQKAHQSRGLTNTRERIQLLNDIYKTGIDMQLREIPAAEGGGTIVVIRVPILNKLSR